MFLKSSQYPLRCKWLDICEYFSYIEILEFRLSL